MLTPQAFFPRLRGRLMGISDRMLSQHIELYVKYINRLNAIEAAYPMTNWTRPLGAPGMPGNDQAPAGLLEAPVASLELHMVGPIADIKDRVLAELRNKNIFFVPNFYLGDGEWWTTNLAVSINVPWFLANPTLWRLANRQSQTAETIIGATKTMRHEIGHAVNYAYELWKRPDWTAMFGDFTAPYRDVFPSDPRSEEHVEYLDNVSEHYPQKHPDEDWAETFACWLDPHSNWKQEYADWPKALAKLEYVDKLSFGVLSLPPTNTYIGKPEPYTMVKGTVGQLLGTAEGTQPFNPLAGWSEHSELLRQEPEAYNAVALHESYFDCLDGFGHPNQGAWPPPLLKALVTAQWGSWDSYMLDLRAILGSTNGWALTVWDPLRQQVRNVMVQGHRDGVPVNCKLLLAIDSWEHAYTADYGTRKDIYIGAVMRNVDWDQVEGRLVLSASPGIPTQGGPAPPPAPGSAGPPGSCTRVRVSGRFWPLDGRRPRAYCQGHGAIAPDLQRST